MAFEMLLERSPFHLAPLATLALLALLFLAAGFDIVQRKVPNILIAGGLAIAFVLAVTSGWPGLGRMGEREYRCLSHPASSVCKRNDGRRRREANFNGRRIPWAPSFSIRTLMHFYSWWNSVRAFSLATTAYERRLGRAVCGSGFRGHVGLLGLISLV
jgi:hypothetical protein